MNYVAQSRDYQFEPLNQSAPTQARPGSAQKLQVMAERYRSGQPLHHLNDETLVTVPVRRAMSAFLASGRHRENEPYSRAGAILKKKWLKQMLADNDKGYGERKETWQSTDI